MKEILDDKKKGEVCGILSVGGTFAMAAHHVGCSRMTIYRTANRDPEFKRRIYRAQTKSERIFLRTIKRAATQTRYWTAARWALQHMYPDRYARRPFTMGLADVKDLISQVMNAIAAAIKDPPTRAAVRKAIRSLVDDAVRKSKERHCGQAQLKLDTTPPPPPHWSHWPTDAPMTPNHPRPS